MWMPNAPVYSNNALNIWNTTGHKQYELSNHLGNVVTTVSDVINADASGNPLPDILSAQDYYAFGSQQPNRSYARSNAYRYGFNGKENDNEVKGPGNEQDYGMRIYDPRVSRFLSVDPLTKNYPALTPYQFASNRPIDGIDQDGLEWNKTTDKGGHTNITVNVDLSLDKNLRLTPEQLKEYKDGINAELGKVLRYSSGNQYTGVVTYNGKQGGGRLVPKLNIYGEGSNLPGLRITGMTTNGASSINIYRKDGSLRSVEDVAIDGVHELFHTLRVEHPFEKTQSADTKLVKIGPNQFKSVASTSPNILYNIMNYSVITIDGQKLGDLWKTKKPSLLTSGQIKLINSEISLQMQGYGIYKYDKNLSLRQNESNFKKYYNDYWLNAPGTDVKKGP
jgi:RHS repeat-associated protein